METGTHDNRGKRVRTTGRVKFRREPPNHRLPVPAIDRVVDHAARLERARPERRRPFGPRLARRIERKHFERGAVFVDGDKTFSFLAADLDLDSRDAAQAALVEMREDAFDKRMAGREEVQRFIFDRFLAIERANVARAGRNSRQAVNERLVAELNREDPPRARALRW